MTRREFARALAALAGAPLWSAPFSAAAEEALYDLPPFGEARVLHTCDIHAQLLPVHYREPNVNLGFGAAKNQPPHLVGEALLERYGIARGSRLAHALSHIGFDELARRYGKMGGLAHLKTLTARLRGDARASMHLDSGDLWQGSYGALASGGLEMAEAGNLLGIDAMTGHWEFAMPARQTRAAMARSRAAFVAQNVFVTEEALFDGAPAHDEDSGRAFAPYTVQNLGGRRIVVIGQAFPFVPISHPRRFTPDWTFGIRAEALQEVIDAARAKEKPDAVILLSHNGAGLDAALAHKVRGLDFILGGHTHDNLYQPIVADGTVVVNTGCAGKFVGCLDIAFGAGGVRDYRWSMLPVFADVLPADTAMQKFITEARAPYADMLSQPLARTRTALYRRGNFNGTMDQLIVDALRQQLEADIALSPGFRWGTTVAAGDAITMEDVYNATAITYPHTYARDMTGQEIMAALEGVADNLYHEDAFYRQGGDMVRAGGLRYTLAPAATGRRIDDARLSNGEKLRADKSYRVAGWATQTPSSGAPVWEVVAAYLRDQKEVDIKLELPTLRGVRGNAGIANYPPELLADGG